MESAVTPVSEASFEPPPPPPPPESSPPPQAASVEATVAAASTVTRRREDLDNGSPLVRPGRRCPGVWWGGNGRSRGLEGSAGSRGLDRVALTARRDGDRRPHAWRGRSSAGGGSCPRSRRARRSSPG